jgi:hypothetical protein
MAYQCHLIHLRRHGTSQPTSSLAHVSLKRMHSLAPPPCLEGCGILSLRPLCLELFGQLDHGAEQGRTIVLQQLDQPGFLHESAQLDELACSCATFLDPVACVGAVLCEHEPISQHGQALELSR